jgi:tRNA A-37 threonylcarbamoyl transferase component Bud32
MATSLPPEYQQTVRVSPVTPLSPVTSPDTPQMAAPHMALVEGSRPGLSQEINNVLRDRLRIASLLLAFSFFVFFVKNLFSLGDFQLSRHWALFWSQVGVMLLTTTLGVRLCSQCPHILKHLRLTELLVFGAPAAFFAVWGYVLLHDAAEQNFAITPIYPWILLIFIYALFIPNTWRRAAVVVGVMAAAPVIQMLWITFVSEEMGQVTGLPVYRKMLTDSCLVMPITALIAVGGVHTINKLRREAFEARQIGQYRLKKKLGSGGMGEVYLAEHVLLKRPCAIKVIRPEKAGDPKALARFEREVQATAKLTHWNTVEIYDYGRTDDGTFYYVMEYLPGMNLEDLVRMDGPLPAERVIYLLSQVCDALSEAHCKGMVHRDIKPANIFAARRGGVYDVAKLLDFGLVKPTATQDEEQVNVTQDGMVAGSPLYMSPEQALGEQPDERSDIYSLGLTAYYLLTGRPPFEADKPIKVLLAHAHETPTPPSQWNADVPRDLEAVVLKCLEKDPTRRFQDTESLREALESCDAAGLWTRTLAAEWWNCSGCPHKKQLDAEVFEGVVACA